MLFPSYIIIISIIVCQFNTIQSYKLIIEITTPATTDKNVSNKDVNSDEMTAVENSFEGGVNLEEVMNSCNESFRTTIEFLNSLSETGKFPDESDKTPMCFVRCIYENMGLIKNDILNKDVIQKIIWPATGDSVATCQEEGKNEANPCLRTYLKARCLMLRAIVDGKGETKT